MSNTWRCFLWGLVFNVYIVKHWLILPSRSRTFLGNSLAIEIDLTARLTRKTKKSKKCSYQLVVSERHDRAIIYLSDKSHNFLKSFKLMTHNQQPILSCRHNTNSLACSLCHTQEQLKSKLKFLSLWETHTKKKHHVERTTDKLSFEWSHLRFSSTESKVRPTSHEVGGYAVRFDRFSCAILT